MKKLSLLCLAFLFTTQISASGLKIGLVNVQKILLSTKDGKSVMEKLEKKFNERKTSLKKQEEQIKKSSEQFKKQDLVLSDKAKMSKEREIQGMILKLQEETMKAQKEINELEHRLKKPILDKIQKIVMDVSKKEKVDLTFEVGTTPLLYASKKIDLTEQVIKEYDKAK